MSRQRLDAFWPFGAMLGLVLFMSWPVFETRPFDGTNLYILAWADSASAFDLLRVDPAVYPEWRPLSYATVWLQYRWAGTEHLWSYYLVNLALWTGCGWISYLIVRDLTQSTAAGIVAAILVVTSTQIVGSLVLIMERQTLLASLFGLAAWRGLVKAGDGALSPLAWVSVAVLLTASALSKEYGLAFVGAVLCYGLTQRRRDLASAGIAAAALYGVSRLAFAGGAVTPFCDENGYFFGARDVCFDSVNAVTVSQTAYNLVATAMASLLPGTFFDDGRIDLSPRWLGISAVVFAVAVVGWRKGPPAARMGLLVIGLNTLLNFGVYRSRNHLPALCAVAIAAGVGLPVVKAAIQARSGSMLTRAVTVAAVLGLLSVRVSVTRELTSDRVELSSQPDACAPDISDVDRAFTEKIWHNYGLTLPVCEDQ